MEKGRPTKKQQYEKEVHKNLNKYASLLGYHIGSIFLRFANDVYKINSKYFNFKEFKKNEINKRT